jgi:hypothetical protein
MKNIAYKSVLSCHSKTFLLSKKAQRYALIINLISKNNQLLNGSVF